MRLNQWLGIDLPIIQAPMAGVQGSALAIAVSQAGGLGSLPCAMLSPEALRAELRAIEAATDRPYHLNFFCHTQPAPDAAREAAWRQALKPYYLELGLDPDAVVAAPARQPFNAEFAALLDEFSPAVVSFHFGLPGKDLLAPLRARGVKILSSATNLAEAHWLAEHGADAIIAQGIEAGGHRGHFLSERLADQPGTLELVSQIVAELKLPVIAAGGIAEAADVAAAMARGASGVQVGTAYLLCPEASTSPVHRAALQSESAQTTALTNLFSGRPARGILNRLMHELGPISDLPPAFPLASAALAPLRAKAESQGSGDFSPLWAGQNFARCQEVSAAEITRALAVGL